MNLSKYFMTNNQSIEQLSEYLASTLQLNSEIANDTTSTMPADAKTDMQLLKLYVDTVPHYDGNKDTLEVFISSCDFLFSTYNTTTDVHLRNYLIRVILGKLVSRAQILIATRTELDSWEKIKEALRLSFGDQRNIDCLEQDLITLTPFKNEPPVDFGKRIQLARSQLIAKINAQSETTMPRATKLIYTNQYNKVSLKTFIRGLTGNLQSIIRLRNPETLEKAMAYVTEEENFRYTQNIAFSTNRQHLVQDKTPFKSNNVMKSPFNGPTNHQVPPYQTPMFRYQNPHFTPVYNNQFSRPAFPQFPAMQFSQPKPNFPSQPINIQPRPAPPQKFFTNAQVFGKPKAITDRPFKPEPMSTTSRNPTINTYRPEPMSTTSRNPTFNRPNTSFKPSGPRNFVSQELFQIDNHSTEEQQDETNAFFQLRDSEHFDNVQTDHYDLSYENDHPNFYPSDNTNHEYETAELQAENVVQENFPLDSLDYHQT